MQLKKINSYIIQIALAILLSLWFGFFIDRSWFLPTLLGASTCIIPALIFKKISLLGACSQKSAKARLNQFYLAEIIKIASIVLFFVLCLWVFRVNPFVFFLGFVIVQILGWILNLLQLRKS